MKYVKLKKGGRKRMWLHDDVATAMARVPKKAILTYIILIGEVSRGQHPTLTDIAARTNMIPANTSRTIKQLEKAGMIEVERTPAKGNRYKFPHPDFWKV